MLKHKLNVWKTRCKNGILIYFWLSYVVFMSSNWLQFIYFYVACLSPVGDCRSVTPDSAELSPCSCWQTHHYLQCQVEKVCRQQEEEEEGDIQEADSYQVRTHQTLQTQPGRDTFCGREGMVRVCVCVHHCLSLSLSLSGLLLLVIPFIHPTFGHNPPAPPPPQKKKKKEEKKERKDHLTCD